MASGDRSPRAGEIKAPGELRDDLDETVFLGVRSGRGDVKVIAKAVSRAQIRGPRSEVGPSWASSPGAIVTRCHRSRLIIRVRSQMSCSR